MKITQTQPTLKEFISGYEQGFKRYILPDGSEIYRQIKDEDVYLEVV